ncbi:putative cyclase/dehydrase [Magnetofaba australis IT-1]|uniref:Putative cyclase/dehydrase n=2 Tax=Magnetofaba TaxID=1472292 RepID=A0A1Y2KAK1_9PROT|nr:putative cyclase/dehydrase [Magnetofaba australis IT-1]
MYALVVDVDNYPQFLNWCVAARILEQRDDAFEAELTVAFKGVREKFRTLDKIIPNESVEISLLSGPFRHLNSHWKFTPMMGGKHARIDFSIDFLFKNPVLNLTLGPVFSHISKQMVQDYRKRAQQVYGSAN